MANKRHQHRAACLHLWLVRAQGPAISARADSPGCVYTSCSKDVFWQHAAHAATRHKDRTFLEGSSSPSFATDITSQVFFHFSICISFFFPPKTDFLQGSCFFTSNSCQFWWENVLNFTECGWRTKNWGQCSGHTRLEKIFLYLAQERTGLGSSSSTVFLHGCSKVGLKIAPSKFSTQFPPRLHFPSINVKHSTPNFRKFLTRLSIFLWYSFWDIHCFLKKKKKSITFLVTLYFRQDTSFRRCGNISHFSDCHCTTAVCDEHTE